MNFNVCQLSYKRDLTSLPYPAHNKDNSRPAKDKRYTINYLTKKNGVSVCFKGICLNCRFDMHPFMFTHQGASWTTGMVDVANVPFPYDVSKMPATPASAKGTWVDLDTEILTSLNFNWQQTIMNSISGSKATHPTPDLRSVLLIRKRPLQAIIRGESVTPLIKAGCRKFSFNIFEK